MILRTLCCVTDARDTFSMCLLATAAGAGVSHATGQDTTGTVLAGLASFSIAMWASSRCRKVRFLLGSPLRALLS